MAISGFPLMIAITVLVIWLVFLLWVMRIAVQSSRGGGFRRRHMTLAGFICASLAVTALVGLHLTWVSADVSQKLGVGPVRFFGLVLIYSTATGLLLSLAGAGKVRFAAVASCLCTGSYWFFLSTGAALVGSPLARHPTRYLIPAGYVGWVTIKYGADGPPLPLSKGTYICSIADSGALATSSALEDGWASDEYFYRSADGALKRLRETGWGKGGMIWSGTVSWQLDTSTTSPKRVTQKFYVGTEDQYHAAVPQ
jgi:hypothetical protein